MSKKEYRTNWRQGVTSPFESNWSKVHKFAFLNRVDATQIKSSLSSADWQDKSLYWGSKAGQLLFPGHLDIQRLSSVFQEDESVLNDGWLEPYRFLNDQWEDYASYLRFCPICIRSGYHSPLYQMLWLSQRPIHHVALVQSCPNCHAEIPLTLTKREFRPYYGCHCGAHLWPGLNDKAA